ncbi:ethanolamine utilization protein EutJ [Pilibacter termitis]|uniref:Ethanolamine utilization protein EutJ n=1 Tax=Pilibacter termitis TaxID=263852 RepID=A0A1T4MKD8_9ENTE|nr:ethanolamine utilization protein EutJ [Pilibacter termitis]SJZ67331.1 ethanolamine utilization protein EutJ [Pilibacter termitis]
MSVLEKANETLAEFKKIVNTGLAQSFEAGCGYKVGVDLGTSSIVLVVLDGENRVLFGAFEYADVIRDGLVVNYQQSVEIVSRLKKQAEDALGFTLKKASGAIPPGTIGNNKRIVGNVIESSGMELDKIVDEPTAAACLLQLEHGAVIDVGGGTTGISIFENGEVILSADEATGGTHMTLVIAGFHKIPIPEAEVRKRNPQLDAECFSICRPVVQRMAEITRKILEKQPSEPLFVVGGASILSEFEQEFSKYLNQAVYKPDYPQFVTPIGIAMSSEIIDEVS